MGEHTGTHVDIKQMRKNHYFNLYRLLVKGHFCAYVWNVLICIFSRFQKRGKQDSSRRRGADELMKKGKK